jgi:hypothetical protein
MQQSLNDNKATVEAAHRWADGLPAVADLSGPRFVRAEPRQRMAADVQELLSPLEHKMAGSSRSQRGMGRPVACST